MTYDATIRDWGRRVRGEVALVDPRAETYRELIFESLSGLLRINLPRTYAAMGDAAWSQSIHRFLQTPVQQSPYFSQLAAEFVPTLDAFQDLAHFEMLQLEVETTTDTDTRRLAAYPVRVTAEGTPDGPTLVLLWRDPVSHQVLYRELPADEFVALQAELDSSGD